MKPFATLLLSRRIRRAFLLSLAYSIPLGLGAATWKFDFSDAPEAWTPQFVDLPADWKTDPLQPTFELVAEYRSLPETLGSGSGYYLAGTNYSDDLLIYVYRQVEGLEPETLYNLSFTVEFASNADQATFGIGGSPGGSVWIKAAASPEEPARITADGYYRTPVEMSNQAGDGAQGGVVGLYGYEDPPANGEWKILTRTTEAKRFSARSDADGRLWVLAGMDSGFEGTSEVYLIRFTVEALSGVWAEADYRSGGGWLHSPWFGWVYSKDLTGGWDYHIELGWLYVLATDPTVLRAWSPELAWIYSQADIYPWLYSTTEGWIKAGETR